MKTNNTIDKALADKIANLTAEHAFKAEIETLFGGYDYLAFRSVTKEYDSRLVIRLTDTRRYELKDIAKHIAFIISTFKPTEQANIIQFAGKDSIITASPYMFRIDNSINSTTVSISYLSNRISVQVELPIQFYSKLIVRPFERGVTDCEYHYYGGVSMTEIRRMRIRCYELNIFDKVDWFGGDRTHYVKDNEDKSRFEFTILNGSEQNLIDSHNEYLATL
jgi:hypothetical protein